VIKAKSEDAISFHVKEYPNGNGLQIGGLGGEIGGSLNWTKDNQTWPIHYPIVDAWNWWPEN
jgi:hypothetical protein